MVSSWWKILQMFDLCVESPCASLGPDSSGEFSMWGLPLAGGGCYSYSQTFTHTLAGEEGQGFNVFVREQAGRTSQIRAWGPRATPAWSGVVTPLTLMVAKLWLLQVPCGRPSLFVTLSLQRVVGNFFDVTYSSFLILSSPCHPNRLSSMTWISLKSSWFLVSDFGLAICHPGSVSPLSVLRMTEHRITSLDKIINASLSNCQ